MSIKIFTPKSCTALQGRSPVSGAVALRELSLVGKISIRGDAEDSVFAAAISKSCGEVLPSSVGQRVSHGDDQLVCLGPNEWMLYTPIESVNKRLVELQSRTASLHVAIVDVSDYFTVLELKGKRVRDVLAKLTPLDVSAAALEPESTRQTRMAKCSVLLSLKSDTCAHLQVRWSHAEYLWDYLAEASREYNL